MCYLVQQNWFHHNHEEKILYLVPKYCTISKQKIWLGVKLRIARKCEKSKCLWKTFNSPANYPNCFYLLTSSSKKIFTTSTNRSVYTSHHNTRNSKNHNSCITGQDQAGITVKVAWFFSAGTVYCVVPAKSMTGLQFQTTDSLLWRMCLSGVRNCKKTTMQGFGGAKIPD